MEGGEATTPTTSNFLVHKLKLREFQALPQIKDFLLKKLLLVKQGPLYLVKFMLKFRWLGR